MDEDVVEVIFVEDGGGADGTREDEKRYDTHVSYWFFGLVDVYCVP
jgi:hypothetical protein